MIPAIGQLWFACPCLTDQSATHRPLAWAQQARALGHFKVQLQKAGEARTGESSRRVTSRRPELRAGGLEDGVRTVGLCSAPSNSRHALSSSA